MSGWFVVLDGVALSGGEDPVGPTGDEDSLAYDVVVGGLTYPPEGMGLPDRRTEDVTYTQRDGVRHFKDWYEPRIITLEEAWICPDEQCDQCPSARVKVADLMQAWDRKCDDVELVIFPDCYDPDASLEDRSLTGPYGVIGRPRVAELEWEGPTGCALLTLRFDGVDQRLYVLDADGTPGSGVQCVTLTPEITDYCRTYDRCYEPDGMCYELQEDDGGGGPVTFDVTGTECAYATITLNPSLTDPVIENTTTGEKIGYSGIIGEGNLPVIINTEDGTATQGGQSRTHLLTGSPSMFLTPGSNTLRLSSFASGDTGTAEVCWRPAVIWG